MKIAQLSLADTMVEYVSRLSFPLRCSQLKTCRGDNRGMKFSLVPSDFSKCENWLMCLTFGSKLLLASDILNTRIWRV